MPSFGHGNPISSVQEGLDTRRKDGVPLNNTSVSVSVSTKEPNSARRLHTIFRKTSTRRHKLHSTSGCPIDQTNFFTAPFFSWLTPIFYKAWKGTLDKDDLFSCSPYESAQVNSDRIEALWRRELDRRGPEDASLARVYFQFLAKWSLVSCVLSLVSSLMRIFSSVMLVRLLIEYCQQETADLGYGLMLAGLLTLCQYVFMFFLSSSWYLNIRSAGRVRAATVGMIYHKTIRLRSMRGLSIGEIVNLCANDSQRLFDVLLYLPHALSGPLVAFAALICTFYLIGPAALLGTGVFIAFYPLQGWFSKFVAHYRRRSVAETDHRVRLMSEIITCIKLIKMYAWEESFAATIGDIRKREQAWLEKSSFLQSISQSFFTLGPIVSTILTLCLHTLLGHDITAAQAFSYVVVLNSIRFTIHATPMAIKSLTEAFVAFPRIKALLLMDELKEFKDKPADATLALSLADVTFAWDREEMKGAPDAPIGDTGGRIEASQGGDEGKGGDGFGDRAGRQRETDPLVDQEMSITKTLFDINLDVKKGQLLGICGSIGSGKSSLLQSVLSRMILLDGRVSVDGSFAYVSQQACIMNVTLRENVLMGAELDQGRYERSVRVCALREDIELLPDGDETEIGERGINISGGQKQRVSLARALYSNKDIYLLDDPLSAVDAHVGKHIFSQCIEGALRGKTILFVTHQLQYLKRCDRIILLKDGRIVEDGTHGELMDNGKEYCNLIRTFHNEDNDDDTVDDSRDDDGDDDRSQSLDGGGALSNGAQGDPGSDDDSLDEGSHSATDHPDTGKPSEDASSSDVVPDPVAPTHSRRPTLSPQSEEGNDVDTRAGRGTEEPTTEAATRRDANQAAHTTDAASIPRIVLSDVDGHQTAADDNRDYLRAEHSEGNEEALAIDDEDEEEEGDDHREGDKRASSPLTPRKAISPLLLQRDLLRVLSTDSGSMGGTVDSEETIFYSGKLMEEEEMGNRGISMGTIHDYVQSAGGVVVATVVVLSFLAPVVLSAFSNWWLSIWLNAGSGNTTIMLDNETEVISNSIADNPRLEFYQLVYALSAVGFLVITVFRSFIFAKATLRASSNLHKKVFSKVVHSPMSFFDTNPLGRILNRFSKDLDELDISFPFNVNPFLHNFFTILFSLLIVTVIFPYLLIVLVLVFGVFLALNVVFRHGIRAIKTFDNLARSPWFSHIMTTAQSLPTIQAYGKQRDFIERFHQQLDDSTNMLILFYLANRWLAIRFDIITVLVTCSAALLAVLTHGSVPAATVGLAISYANQLIGLSQYTVRLAAEANARFTSVERINYYIQNLQQEAPSSIESTKPGPDWPSEGRITVKNLKMRYRQHLPLVLRGVTFETKPSEKIGIVGRTGSGKSSLGVALYRLVEKAYGSITIDGVDISQIGLYDLRSKLSIIPQDPVLFIGTIRYNLDPTNQFTDAEVWQALEKTYMKETISGLEQQLQAPVIENGENFSVGERQLMCMARALLRNSKILILDEATAAIDTETDSLVQQTIRQAFTHCTILTIAHRLNTILDSDRILVLSDGKVLEFDSPSVLLANPASYFAAMMSAMEDKTHQH